METNNTMNEKLIKIQSELKAPKGQYNDYGNYNYRSCEDIFEALKPILLREKLSLICKDELVQIGERYYIKAVVTLSDGINQITNVAYAREEETKKGMDGSQITGASSSYARKYALNGLFMIDDVKDSDSTNQQTKQTKTATKTETKKLKATDAQIKLITARLNEEQIKKVIDGYKLKKLTDLTIKQASAVIKNLPKENENE